MKIGNNSGTVSLGLRSEFPYPANIDSGLASSRCLPENPEFEVSEVLAEILYAGLGVRFGLVGCGVGLDAVDDFGEAPKVDIKDRTVLTVSNTYICYVAKQTS